MPAKWVEWGVATITGFAIQVALYPVIAEGIQDTPARVVVRLFSFVGSVYGMYKLLSWLAKRIERSR